MISGLGKIDLEKYKPMLKDLYQRDKFTLQEFEDAIGCEGFLAKRVLEKLKDQGMVKSTHQKVKKGSNFRYPEVYYKFIYLL